MYNVVKDVIKNGDYNLTDILKKIKMLWLQGDVSEEEYAELCLLSRNGAKTEYSVDVLAKLNDLEKRLSVLEKGNTSVDNTEAVAEFADGKWYYNGDKCIFDGKIYTCVAPDGVVCVWSPADYPTYWEIAE